MPRSGLSRSELLATAERAFSELAGPPAAVKLLTRNGNWLSAMDEAGFVEIQEPTQDEFSLPRVEIDWEGALAAAEYGGPLTARSLDPLSPDDAYGNTPSPEEPRGDLPILRLAASLAGAVPVNLDSVLQSLGRTVAGEILAAVCAVTQSHVLSSPALWPDGRPSGWSSSVPVPELFAWPERDEPGPWVQGELSLFPIAEEEVAVARAAHANPYPSVDLPLDQHVHRVLTHLRPASGGMRGGGRRRAWQLDRSGFEERSPSEIEAWLGFALPRLLSPSGTGQLVHCFTREGGPLPRRGSLMSNGEPWEGDIFLLWVPDGVDPSMVDPRLAVDDGFVTGLVRYSPFTRPDTGEGHRATSVAEPAGGYTGVTVNGVRMSIQHSQEGQSRIGWLKEGPDALFPFGVNVPLPPVAALELVLRGTDIP